MPIRPYRVLHTNQNSSQTHFIHLDRSQSNNVIISYSHVSMQQKPLSPGKTKEVSFISRSSNRPFRSSIVFAQIIQKAKIPPTFVDRIFALAEWEGFEPSRAFWTPTPLAGEPLRPLGYHSESKSQYVEKNKMAERVGFEPTARCRVTGFQDRLLKPLGHLSEFAFIQ